MNPPRFIDARTRPTCSTVDITRLLRSRLFRQAPASAGGSNPTYQEVVAFGQVTELGSATVKRTSLRGTELASPYVGCAFPFRDRPPGRGARSGERRQGAPDRLCLRATSRVGSPVLVAAGTERQSASLRRNAVPKRLASWGGGSGPPRHLIRGCHVASECGHAGPGRHGRPLGVRQASSSEGTTDLGCPPRSRRASARRPHRSRCRSLAL